MADFKTILELKCVDVEDHMTRLETWNVYSNYWPKTMAKPEIFQIHGNLGNPTRLFE